MNTSVGSISFVITAIYTTTFANSVYQILEFNEKAQDIQLRAGIHVITIICAVICMVMALRFFFGNNYYIDDIFSKPSSAISRLYHFTVISVQSLILLGSSFLIKNPHKFALWISVLFFVEVLWYGGCFLFFRSAISNEAGGLNRSLAANEIANLIMAMGAIGASAIKCLSPETVVCVVASIFVGNSIADLKVNLKNYMGTEKAVSARN